MVRVTVEFWMGMGNELGEDFQSPSPVRSVLETVVQDGTKVGELLEDLADRYGPIRERIFSEHCFTPSVVVTLNERIVHVARLCDSTLVDGDRIAVIPVYAGG